MKFLCATLFCMITAASASASAFAYQPFTNPSAAAKRLTLSAKVDDGVRLFHACTVINPYKIQCGGSISGFKPLSKSGTVRVTIIWRKVNPYMLYQEIYMFGGLFMHDLVDTRTAF